jgi:hypothetical protein
VAASLALSLIACASPPERPAAVDAGNPSPHLTFDMSLQGCAQQSAPGVYRCTYNIAVGVERGEYSGELQITDLASAPIIAVTSSVPSLQPSMHIDDQVCEVLTIPNTPAVHGEMGHLGMNEAATLYGWFCRTVDPLAAPPKDERIHVTPQQPFAFTYTLDVDLSALNGAPFRNCAYIDWDDSHLTTPVQSPRACLDFG